MSDINIVNDAINAYKHKNWNLNPTDRQFVTSKLKEAQTRIEVLHNEKPNEARELAKKLIEGIGEQNIMNVKIHFQVGLSKIKEFSEESGSVKQTSSAAVEQESVEKPVEQKGILAKLANIVLCCFKKKKE
jgi:hypothetical protein